MNASDVLILFADLQPPIVARSKTNPPHSLIASASVLAKVGSILDIPLLFTVVPEGGKPAQLIADFEPYATASNTFTRMSATPFSDLATSNAIAANKRRTLVIAGFATEVVTLHAALGALDRGMRVHVVVDCCGGQSARTEDAALRRSKSPAALSLR